MAVAQKAELTLAGLRLVSDQVIETQQVWAAHRRHPPLAVDEFVSGPELGQLLQLLAGPGQADERD